MMLKTTLITKKKSHDKKEQFINICVTTVQCFRIVTTNENINNQKLSKVFIISETALAFFSPFFLQ